jgi:predicted 3-demethylubiquinone-9 3-methyltransferase (glyoxalase superfamily)
MDGFTTCLWFDTQAEEAAAFYCSVFPDSRVTSVIPYGEAGPGEPGTTMVVNFELFGQRFQAINGGPQFTFSEAVSIEVACDGQAEVDHYWDVLTADGGEESMCGWLKDKYGFSWQVIPKQLAEAFEHAGSPEAAKRVTEAMLAMRKIDVTALQAAARGPVAAS